jgi:hypothetical protein
MWRVVVLVVLILAAPWACETVRQQRPKEPLCGPEHPAYLGGCRLWATR